MASAAQIDAWNITWFMSENKAIYPKTINFSAKFISVQQECEKINSAWNKAFEN